MADAAASAEEFRQRGKGNVYVDSKPGGCFYRLAYRQAGTAVQT